jgi:hypothetical protein
VDARAAPKKKAARNYFLAALHYYLKSLLETR